MTYTAIKLDATLARDSLIRQIEFAQIMCAGEVPFKESNVNRKNGRFATEAEKAEMAKEAARVNAAAVASANPGVVELPDGTTTYKLSPKEEGEAAEKTKAIAVAANTAVVKAKLEPVTAVVDLQKTIVVSEPKGAAPAAKPALVQKIAPAKAQAAARITKAVANNLSDDQVRKGLVTVTKQLNSGKPSKPEEVMQMIKDWAAQAQKNIDSGIKTVKSAGSDAKAKALAAGTGLMTKIAEMDVARSLGDVAGITLGAGFAGGLFGGSIRGPIGAVDGAIGGATKALKTGGTDMIRVQSKNTSVSTVFTGASPDMQKISKAAIGGALKGGIAGFGKGALAGATYFGAKGLAGAVGGLAGGKIGAAIGGKLGGAKGSELGGEIGGRVAGAVVGGLTGGAPGAIFGALAGGIGTPRAIDYDPSNNPIDKIGASLGSVANSAKNSAAGRAIDANLSNLNREVSELKDAVGIEFTKDKKAIGGAYYSMARKLGDAASNLKGPANLTNAQVIKPAVQGPANLTNAQVIKPAVQGPANLTNAQVIKPAVQGPANLTNAQVIKPPAPTKSSTQILSDAAVGARASLKNGGLGNAVKAIPGALSQAGSLIQKALSQGNDILHKSVGENIAGNKSLATLAKAVTGELGQVGGELRLGQQKAGNLMSSGAAQTGAAFAAAKADFSKKQAAQAIVLKKARDNAQKAANAQREAAYARR